MSFSDLLKEKTSLTNANLVNASASVMTLAETDNITVAYAGDDFTKSDKYLWYDEYYDDEYSTIDKQKNIVLNKSQINLTQEENSQVIPFMMDRYYDGMDLMKMLFQVHFVNENGDEATVTPVNVQYNFEKIRFYFLVPAEATAVAGTLKFEIVAIGINEKGDTYRWRTKPNADLNVLKSLSGNGIIEPSEGWDTYLELINQKVLQAQNAATEAKNAANSASDTATVLYEKIETVSDEITENVKEEMSAELDLYYKQADADALAKRVANNETSIDNIYAELETFQSDPTAEWVTAYDKKMDTKISNAISPVQEELDSYQEQTEADLKSIHDNIDNLPSTLESDYYKKDTVDTLLASKASQTELNAVKTTSNSNKSNIDSISLKIAEIEEEMNKVNTDPTVYYRTTYDSSTGQFVLNEITTDEEGEEVTTPVSTHIIVGGSGGGTSSSLKIEYVTKTPLVATINDKILLTYKFSGEDSSGDTVLEAQATWKVGGKVVATNTAVNGENTFDITDYVTIGSQKVLLSIQDDAGSLVTKTWSIQKIDVRLESTFNDSLTYPLGDISFNYTPYGSIVKDVHFILDDKEIGVVNTNVSGIPMSFIIPSQTHGSHLMDAYITVSLNNNTIESNHIVKDIIWYDSTSSIPVIGCVQQNFSTRQYDTTNIVATVFDPSTETPTVTIAVDGEIVSTQTLTSSTLNYPFKSDIVGKHIITITCGDTVKTLVANVEKLDIDITPVTAGLVFDFNPYGKSNNDEDRLWSYNNVAMDVSDNFDWVNGGYQIDENGDQYFCVKAGTTATINYNLFADDPKKNGKEFKIVFRTKNIRKRETSFLTCLNNGIGLDMKVEYATVYDNGGSLKSNYCEDTIIEYEFNINRDTDMMVVMSYEDGTPGKPYEYTETSSFKQTSPQPITIGSADCDVYIYRMKAYSNSLTDIDIKNNFIADARNADEIVRRYTRNQIYNENGGLVSTSTSGDFNVDALMRAAPDLKYIFLEVPQFTNDKDNKIDGCTVYFRYPNGTRPQDNWDCVGVRHRGQGTSSNLYGYAGRNVDLCMDRDESLFTYTDEEGNKVESYNITLTDTSYPTDYMNIKVNIASSENTNNAEMARRFNEFQPFLRYARKKDSRIKDTMEFCNCVVFIRETNEDLTTHREFNDTNWHFYSLGNVGDSKKTDDTRVNNKKDPKEHVVEIMDADVDLAKFPTGKDGNSICPVDEWCSGNTAYDILYSTDYVYEDGEFVSFGNESYEFRYEMKDITEEQREENINAWRNLYTFIVTSTDEEFYANLKNYFVVDSALYYYLFTERYTMVDNRAKNSFWHYGKVYISNEEATELGETEASYYIIDDEMAAINDGYRYDLTFGYDFDTALGIDNTGDYVFSYGKEDTDYYVDGDPTSDYVFRVADSTFFCRLRDLFPSEMQAMFKDREEKGAWNSTSLINQWDNSQSQFPEELWRLDYERKYYRTYLGLSVDNSINTGEGRGIDKTFLIGKFFGRKKYSRRAFEINQEVYFATKYFGNKALSDVFWIRGNVPIGSNITPNYSLTLVPYSNMYVCVKYGSTGEPIHKKVKAGETCVFESDAERMDFIYVYAASYIQEVGDLSKCFIGDNNFASATRLQKLVIGCADEGYENTFMTEVLVANNTLLEYLDLRNVSGLNTVINVSGCGNLKELYAEGTNASGVVFANGGMLETAHLPKIASLSMKNLNNIKNFVVEGYDNLSTLIVEHCPAINTYSIVNVAPKLNIVRLIGVDWNKDYLIKDASVLDRLLLLYGIDSSGYETDVSVLTGKFHSAVIRSKRLETYKNTWKDLDITFDSMIEQYPVTFVNYDGTVLEVQYVDKGENAIDPITRIDSPIAIPTKPSSVSHDFTFSNWDSSLDKIFTERTITAVYTESLRSYTIKYVSKGTTMQESTDLYGNTVFYTGIDPIYTSEESAYVYHLFNRWDKSGYIDGDKIINAIFDRFEYTEGYFDGKELSDLSPVEIYAMTKLGLETSVLQDMDTVSFSVGMDYEYDDIESHLLIADKTSFNGSQHIDTEIKLFDEDRDFVLAIDYEFLEGTEPNSVLAQCFQSNGSNGFKLWYNGGNKVTWGTSSNNVGGLNYREMLIIRHCKGENNLWIYNSNLDSDEPVMLELTRSKTTIADSTLVFGASKADDGLFENYAIGNIHWCKLWYTDLGDDVCKKLAGWTHEKLSFHVCGFKRYYLSDNPSKRCSFSLLASHLLERDRRLTNTQSNAGGWAAMQLNALLNKRLYNALPTQWKALIKKVTVSSSIGSKSTEISTSECYVTIPSCIEVDSTMTTEPYINEGSSISYMTTNDMRKRAYDGGDYHAYWLRSPNISYTNYMYQVDADGNLYGYHYPNYTSGVLIEISI